MKKPVKLPRLPLVPNKMIQEMIEDLQKPRRGRVGGGVTTGITAYLNIPLLTELGICLSIAVTPSHYCEEHKQHSRRRKPKNG